MNPDDDEERGELTVTLAPPDPESPRADAHDDDPPAVKSSPPQHRRRWLRIATAGIVAAATATGVVLLSLYASEERRSDQLSQQAVSAARDYLVAMASFDYERLDANRDTIIANSTPEFSHKYDEMVGALRDIVVTSKGVAVATADHVAVERIDDGSAIVIGFVDQHVTNVTAPQGNDQKYRMVVDLIRSDDRWIVNNVETV